MFYLIPRSIERGPVEAATFRPFVAAWIADYAVLL
jgi:hypothetical protein